MNKQISLSCLNEELEQVRIRKKEFLEQIERIVPWDTCVDIIKAIPHRKRDVKTKANMVK